MRKLAVVYRCETETTHVSQETIDAGEKYREILEWLAIIDQNTGCELGFETERSDAIGQ